MDHSSLPVGCRLIGTSDERTARIVGSSWVIFFEKFRWYKIDMVVVDAFVLFSLFFFWIALNQVFQFF